MVLHTSYRFGDAVRNHAMYLKRLKALSRFCRRVEEREWSLKRPLIVAEFRKLASGLRGLRRAHITGEIFKRHERFLTAFSRLIGINIKH